MASLPKVTCLMPTADRRPFVAQAISYFLAQDYREKELVIVPKATHLFEEPGALEEVGRLATAWFRRHFIAELPATAGH